MQRRRRQQRIPGGLAVEMRVYVDEAWRDQQAARIDLALATLGDRTHRSNPIPCDADITDVRSAPRTINDGTATDH